MAECHESKAHTLHDGESTVTIHHSDCIEAMNQMPPESVDAIVTDPPYGLGFMGKKWDDLPPSLEWAEACYRVLKPGGHIVAFGGTRTWHRLAVAIEDAGFEMRDSLAWLYGSGFPKSMNLGKAIESTVTTGKSNSRSLRKTEQDGDGEAYTLTGKNNGIMGETRTYERKTFTPATPEAVAWDGWGTALKPAFEPIVLARKPLAEKTVAKNVLAHGTGAINVDACRIATDDDIARPNGATAIWQEGGTAKSGIGGGSPSGRWPANVLLDEHAAAWVDEQSGVSASTQRTGRRSGKSKDILGDFVGQENVTMGHTDSGGASRFFPVFKYQAKAPKRERPVIEREDGTKVQHPTVKPLAIMRWLIRLVTPPGGTVLDPFAGSGTTLEAALIEGFNPVGIELEAEYIPLIQHRIERCCLANTGRLTMNSDEQR